MLEIKQPGRRYSAYWDGVGTLNQGEFVYLNGKATADLGPTAKAGGPKYASSGDIIVSLATPTSSQTEAAYPVKHYHYKLEDADVDIDAMTSGMYLVYYQGGEYETDQYGAISDSTPGKRLFLDTNGKLTDVTGVSSQVAVLIDRRTTFDSNFSATGMLWFRMLEWPVAPSGGFAL